MQNKKISTLTITKVSILSAMSAILYNFEFRLPIFPEFLKIDLTDIPSIIGTIALGPIAGVFIQLIKNLIHAITIGETSGIGETANFIVGIAYIIPFGVVFKNIKNTRGYIIGSVLGAITMVIVACFINYFFLVPAYAKIWGMPIQAFVDMAHAVNKNVVTFKDYIILAIAPFNILKAFIISIVAYFIYLPLKRAL